MNRRELTELRRRIRPEDSTITRFYGCYVNELRQIISAFSVSTATMSETESGMYYDILRKAISGTTGKNLVTVSLDKNGPHRRLLNDVRTFGEKDETLRERFFKEIIEYADMEGNYLILLALDSYDVPYRSAAGDLDRGASSAVYSYFICALCPVIDAEAKLAYISDEREFHSNTVGQTVGAPTAGILYPSFAGRSSNLEKAVYYMKSAAEPHDGLAEGIFGTERPMLDAERREAFRGALGEVTDGACDFATVQLLYQTMREKTEELKTSENPEMDMLRPEDLRDILEEGGLEAGRAKAFAASYAEAVGKDARVMPSAVMESARFQMETEGAKITVSPELSPLVKIRTVDGKRYVLIPVDGGVEVNGVRVH